MLRFTIRNRLAAESFGRAWRLVAVALFTPFGLVPRGNTGGAGVSPFTWMPRRVSAALPVQAKKSPRCQRTMAGRMGSELTPQG